MTAYSRDIAESQSAPIINDSRLAFVDEYMRVPPAAEKADRAVREKCPESSLERASAVLPDADFKFSGQLFLIGGVADTAWNDMIARLPANARVVAVGLAAGDGDGASAALAKDFEESGIKPENITMITGGAIPAGSKYKWSRELPDKFDLIYFGGGDQALLKERFTQVDKLREALQHGAMVAGNSAGTAVMSSEMITGGDAGSLSHGEGFALLPWAITDTHVHERHREDRDLSALYEIGKGKLPVVGIDADTRVIFRWEGDRLVGEVGGSGSVRVFKAGGDDLKVESEREVKPVLSFGTDGAGKGKAALVWELKGGDRFYLR